MIVISKRALEKGHCFITEELFKDTIETEKILSGHIMLYRAVDLPLFSYATDFICNVTTKCMHLIQKHRHQMKKNIHVFYEPFDAA